MTFFFSHRSKLVVVKRKRKTRREKKNHEVDVQNATHKQVKKTVQKAKFLERM